MEIVTPGRSLAKIYSKETIQSSRKFFGFAISQDPGKILHNACYPGLAEMPNQVAVLLRFEAEQRGISGRTDLLESGIRDVYELLEDSMLTKSAEDARHFSAHPNTIRSFAAIALRDGVTISAYIRNLQAYHQLADADYLDVDTTYTNTRSGCPFAGSGGEIHIDPLFARFIPWAAELAIHSIEHQRKNAT